MNASKVFAVLDECDCEHECDCATWQHEDITEGLRVTLESSGFNPVDEFDNIRSYPGKVIASKSVDYGYYGQIRVKAIARSAYYQGFNLDWELEYYVDDLISDDGLPEITDIVDVLEWLYDNNRGMAVIQAKNYHRFFEKQTGKLIEALEKVYAEFTTPLRCIGRASNGEAFYEKVIN